MFTAEDFAEFLKSIHTRTEPKEQAFLWSPAMFDPSLSTETRRGKDNITGMYGLWWDNDGGGITWQAFASMFPRCAMIIYRDSYNSTPEREKYRVVMPSTCALTMSVHDEIMRQFTGDVAEQRLLQQAATGEAIETARQAKRNGSRL